MSTTKPAAGRARRKVVAPDANPYQTIAAVDLGSNSFHLIVARLEKDGEIKLLDRLREPVRLGAGLDDRGYLGEEAVVSALDCLRRFGQRLQHVPSKNVRALGTNTLRKARNAQQFLLQAQQVLGHPIEVISGVEEARLIYAGVAQGISSNGKQRLVVDIGGGSTELIIGANHKPKHMNSLYMGCISYSKKFFPDGGITQKAMDKAVLAARQELEPVADLYREQGWDHAIGSSGTIKAIADVLQGEGLCQDGISFKGLQKLAQRVTQAGHLDRLDLVGLKADRKPVFAGGLAILLGVAEELRIDSMQVSELALREGALYDLVGRLHHSDVRERSVLELARRYHVNPRRSELIQQTALNSLQQVAKSWQIDLEWGSRFLRWSAMLHTIGLDIAYSGYHRHSAYVIEHAELLGFSRQEKNFLALLVRSHRRKLDPESFQTLLPPWNKDALHLATLLRLAVVLHRGRQLEPVPDFALQAEGNGLHCKFPASWISQSPLTVADLEQEQSYLQAAGLALSFA